MDRYITVFKWFRKIESEDSQKEELKIEQKAENKIIQEKDTFVKTPETVNLKNFYFTPC